MKFEYALGATPIDQDELDGLVPGHISTQSELNAWEAANIAKARLWIRRKKITNEVLLAPDFIHKLHKQMFHKTWKWAGEFRRSNKNIGVEAHLVGNEVAKLLDDVRYWIDNETYPKEEIATRLHHLLVWIHPFPNGNGRFGRFYTDLFLNVNNLEPFTWGGSQTQSTSDTVRQKYIQALRKADNHDYGDLLAFVKS